MSATSLFEDLAPLRVNERAPLLTWMDRRDAVVALHHQESAALHDGNQLGPVGGRIVDEVVVSIVDGDPGSFRSVDATLPGRRGGGFGLSDTLAPIA